MDKKQIQTYFDGDCKLIPLHKWDTLNREGDPVGKAPLTKWRGGAEFPLKQIKECILKGHNVGYPILEGEMVVDMDPRNYGDLSKEEIEDRISELFGHFDFKDLVEDNPTVITGQKGYHIYLQFEQGTNLTGLRETVEGFPGVEFKKSGKYVVCAGSRHPNGEWYKWCSDVPIGKRVVVGGAVAEKLKTLLKKEYGSGSSAGDGGNSLAGILSCEKLEEWILNPLHVTDFDTNEKWQPVMMGCHHATKGEGIEEFVAWCLGDIKYGGKENSIRNRWDSCNYNSSNPVTVQTLMSILQQNLTDDEKRKRSFKAFSACLDRHSAMTDFKDLGEVGELSEEEIKEEFGANSKALGDPDYVEGAARQAASKLQVSSTRAEIEAVLELIKDAGPLERAQALELAKIQTKITLPALKSAYKDMQDIHAQDIGRVLCNLTLRKKFNAGFHLDNLPMEVLFYYEGRYWHRISSSYVGRLTMDVYDDMKTKADVGANESALVSSAVNLIRMQSSSLTDRIHRSDVKDRQSIINCLNHEIHIKGDGSYELHKHSYDSYQLSLLNIHHDPKSAGVLFEQTLREIFRDFPDTEDMVRHMCEVLGYIIQPKKNLANWWIFKGPGGDGKSTILKVLDGLLGDAYVGSTVKLFGMTGTGSDNHVTTNLVAALCVVIEELPVNCMLKDEVLKHFSENTKMECNYKGKDKTPFIFCGSLIMCTNTNPKTKDTSVGFRRRANIVPFGRQFTAHGDADVDRAEKILGSSIEMSAALNLLLAGLKRVRQRGGFKVPASCKLATDSWLTQSNNMARFLKDKLELTHDLRDCLGELGSLHGVVYNHWCQGNDIEPEFRKNKTNFKEHLENLGLVIREGKGNKLKVYGGRFLDVEESDEDE